MIGLPWINSWRTTAIPAAGLLLLNITTSHDFFCVWQTEVTLRRKVSSDEATAAEQSLPSTWQQCDFVTAKHMATIVESTGGCHP